MRHTGWIIYPRYTASHSDNAFGWLAQEAAAFDIDLKVVFIEDISIVYGQTTAAIYIGNQCISELPSFVIIRTYDTTVSRYFERLGILVINSATSMELCKNKMLTHEILHDNGLPTPLTVYREGGEYNYSELSSFFGGPTFIVKQIDGAKGENVFLVSDAKAMNAAIGKCGGRCLCQQFVATSYGRDVRVWVIGGKVAGAVLRYSETSFLSNFSQGGNVDAIDLPSDASELAVHSATAVGAKFAGIDLLFTSDGFTVNEINGNAGFRTLSRIGINDIPHKLFAYIKEMLH